MFDLNFVFNLSLWYSEWEELKFMFALKLKWGLH